MSDPLEGFDVKTSKPELSAADRASLEADTRKGRPHKELTAQPIPQSPQTRCQCPDEFRSSKCHGILRKHDTYTFPIIEKGKVVGRLEYCSPCGEDQFRREGLG